MPNYEIYDLRDKEKELHKRNYKYHLGQKIVVVSIYRFNLAYKITNHYLACIRLEV